MMEVIEDHSITCTSFPISITGTCKLMSKDIPRTTYPFLFHGVDYG